MTMTPIYFDGCFGWLHAGPAVDEGGKAVGVVVCPAFGQEEICTHYGLMAFADTMAAQGMPTVRFDYRGTGDSCSAEVSFAGMVADAGRAVAYLRQECGVGTVVLAGVRLGTAVALHAAGELTGVGAVVLMAPTSSGQAYMRETRAAAKVSSLSRLDPVPTLESGDPLNTNGFHWTGALQQEIAAIDFKAVAAPAMPVLLMPGREDRRTAALLAAWREEGHAQVTELAFTGYEKWMQDPTTSTTPVESFAAITDWLNGLKLDAGAGADETRVKVSATLAGDGFVEEPIRFGAGDVVFGVLCRPREREAAPVAALLLHEGSSHHIGDGGAYVVLARRLAEEGIASLRMDLTGMGDSPAGDNPRHPHYDPERIVEGIAGIELLEQRGFGQVVVFGLCSGAYTALQVTLMDERVVGNVIANLQKFIWHYGDDIRVTERNNKRSFKAYMRAVGHSGEWRRALAGNADLKGILRVLTRRTAKQAYHAVRGLLPPAAGSETARVYQQMRALAARRVQTNLLFGDDDPGLAEMWIRFGRKARRLAAYAPARMLLLPHADHHFNGTAARRRYYELASSIMKTAIAEHGAEGTR
jgi:pimeloyl-ACP methyl ester carboxylesterase